MCRYIKYSFVILLLLAATTNMATAANVVLSEQSFSFVGKDGHLAIQFQKPMGYITHSPTKNGKTLVIKLKDLFPAADTNNVSERLVVSQRLKSPIDYIQYEQNGTTNGLLTIQFTRDIEYTIEFSRDRKSVSVVLKNVQTVEEELTQPQAISSDLPIYALNLLTSTTPIDVSNQPALVNFTAFDIYTDVHRTAAGKTLYGLHLGYFYYDWVSLAH